jgi:hypothetical protein
VKENYDLYQVTVPDLGRVTVDSMDLEIINSNAGWTLTELLTNKDSNFRVLVSEHGVLVSHPDYPDGAWYTLSDISPRNKNESRLRGIIEELIAKFREEVRDHEKSMGSMHYKTYTHVKEYEEAGLSLNLLETILRTVDGKEV